MSLSSRYPEHAKLLAQQAHFDELVKFADWMSSQYDVGEVTDDSYEPGFQPSGHTPRFMVCLYLDIDYLALQAEEAQMRDEMITRLRQEQTEQH